MQTYRILSGGSGVVAYEIGSGAIRVKFRVGLVYEYTNESAGVQNIEQMKRLAAAGAGLNTFINKHVKKMYAREW